VTDRDRCLACVCPPRRATPPKPASDMPSCTGNEGPDYWRGYLAGRAVPPQQSGEGMVLPPMNDDLRDILGRMCFQFIGIAQLMRAGGLEVKTRAEDEQAEGIYWMLSLYAKHGPEWRKAASEQLREWQEAYKAKKAASAPVAKGRE
jgi:hypothetical protein